MKINLFLLLIFSWGVTVSTAFAQSFYKERIPRNYIFTAGIGPSFSYLDNGGPYRTVEFEIKPALSLGLSKKISPMVELRTTAGIQWIGSSGNHGEKIKEIWAETNSSFTANGQAYFLDIMPNFYLVPFSHHMHRTRFNFYGGLGLGVLRAVTDQTKTSNPEERPFSNSVTTAYVPVRAGLSYSLGPYSDIAGEGTMIWTFADNLDGNVGNNRFGDHFFQAQIVYRRYFIPKTK